jgi:hypothetical protein
MNPIFTENTDMSQLTDEQRNFCNNHYFKRQDSQSATCNVCKKRVKNSQINKHVLQKMHVKKHEKQTKLNLRFFMCILEETIEFPQTDEIVVYRKHVEEILRNY